MDDEVLNEYQASLPRNMQHPFQAMGSAEENLHPGLAISRFCRMAESSEQSHPNGENMVSQACVLRQECREWSDNSCNFELLKSCCF